MNSALADLLKLARPSGRIPGEIPAHYVQHVAAIHRAATLARINNRMRTHE